MVNFSALNRVLTEENDDYEILENVPKSLVSRILERNTRLEAARSRLEGTLVFRYSSGRNVESGVSVEFSSDRKGRKEFFLEFTGTGITACPCSMGKIRDRLTGKYPSYAESIKAIPQITHNQRVKITFQIQSSRTVERLSATLLELSEQSIGNLLSHNQSEAEVNDILLAAHESPMLIEDVARAGSEACRRRLKKENGIISARIKCESEESIHSFNARSEKLVLF